jgi:hypothetical protein
VGGGYGYGGMEGSNVFGLGDDMDEDDDGVLQKLNQPSSKLLVLQTLLPQIQP